MPKFLLRNIQDALEFVKNYPSHLFLMVLVTLVLWALPFPLASLGEEIADGILARQVEYVQSAIDGKKDLVAKKAYDLASSPYLYNLIKVRNNSGIQELLENDLRGLGNLFALVTDETGAIVYRSANRERKGDYVFQSTDWGRRVSEGLEVAVIDESQVFPLMIIAGSPLIKDGDIRGAVFLGWDLDEDFADSLKKESINANVDLVFYSEEEGIIADTLKDGEEKKIVDSSFNYGSDWITGDKTVSRVNIAGSDFLVSRSSFLGSEEGSKSGYIVFLRYFPIITSGAISSTVSLLFAGLMFIFHKRRRDEKPSS